MARYAVFPNQDFPYGGDCDVTPEENNRYKATNEAFIAALRARDDWRELETKTEKLRVRQHPNRWGVDEDKYDVGDGKGPATKSYWESVLQDVGVKSWINPEKFIEHLCKMKPDAVAGHSTVWRWTNAPLDDAFKGGSNGQWEKLTGAYDLALEEQLEALRIVGDKHSGLGVMPVSIVKRLKDSGLLWLTVDPTERVVPLCWQEAAKCHGLAYAKIRPNDFQPFEDTVEMNNEELTSQGVEKKFRGQVVRFVENVDKKQLIGASNTEIEKLVDRCVKKELRSHYAQIRPEPRPIQEDEETASNSVIIVRE